jgi:DNA invertase Pin-like site-specific DNA recombinase
VENVVDAKPTGKLIGYARVSTEDQELRLQIDALERAGCWNIYKEHRSATRGKRPELELAIMDLRPGDILVTWKLDRLGRNMRQLYAILDRIHAAGASFKSLTEGIDFSTPTGELMFGMLGHFAQFEAAMTAKRTAAGIKALQDRGFLYGAKPKLSDARAAQLVKLRKTGLTKAVLAKRFGISPASVSNYLKRAKAKPRRK